MELGTLNGSNIRESLSLFFEGTLIQCSYRAEILVLSMRSVEWGPVGQIATSPDLFGAVSKLARSLETSRLTLSDSLETPASQIQPVVFEFKTYTAGLQVKKLSHIIKSHGKYIEDDLGFSAINDETADPIGLEMFQMAADNLLREVFPDPSYRYQVLHPSLYFDTMSRIRFVPCRDFLCCQSRIPLNFSTSIQNTLKRIVNAYLKWIVDELISIPK